MTKNKAEATPPTEEQKQATSSYIIRIQMPASLLTKLLDQDAELQAEITKAVRANLYEEISRRTIEHLRESIDFSVCKEIFTSAVVPGTLQESYRRKLRKTIQDAAPEIIRKLVTEEIDRYLGRMSIKDYLDSVANRLLKDKIAWELQNCRKDILAMADTAVSAAIKEKLNL